MLEMNLNASMRFSYQMTVRSSKDNSIKAQTPELFNYIYPEVLHLFSRIAESSIGLRVYLSPNETEPTADNYVAGKEGLVLSPVITASKTTKVIGNKGYHVFAGSGRFPTGSVTGTWHSIGSITGFYPEVVGSRTLLKDHRGVVTPLTATAEDFIDFTVKLYVIDELPTAPITVKATNRENQVVSQHTFTPMVLDTVNNAADAIIHRTAFPNAGRQGLFYAAKNKQQMVEFINAAERQPWNNFVHDKQFKEFIEGREWGAGWRYEVQNENGNLVGVFISHSEYNILQNNGDIAVLGFSPIFTANRLLYEINPPIQKTSSKNMQLTIKLKMRVKPMSNETVQIFKELEGMK